MSLDFSTFVLLPNAANPAPGMMKMESTGAPPKKVTSPLKRSLSAHAPAFVPSNSTPPPMPLPLPAEQNPTSPPSNYHRARVRSHTLSTLYEHCEMKYDDDTWSSDSSLSFLEEDIYSEQFPHPLAPPPTPSTTPSHTTHLRGSTVSTPEAASDTVFNFRKVATPAVQGMTQEESLLALAIQQRLEQEKLELMAKTMQILQTQEQLRRIACAQNMQRHSSQMTFGANQNRPVFNHERTMSVDSGLSMSTLGSPFSKPFSPPAELPSPIGTPVKQRSFSFGGPSWTPLASNA